MLLLAAAEYRPNGYRHSHSHSHSHWETRSERFAATMVAKDMALPSYVDRAAGPRDEEKQQQQRQQEQEEVVVAAVVMPS